MIEFSCQSMDGQFRHTMELGSHNDVMTCINLRLILA